MHTVLLWFVVISHEVFIHIHQGCFAGTEAIVRSPQCQRSKPDGYGKIIQCITTTKHSKAKTVCIFLGIYCIYHKQCRSIQVLDIQSCLWNEITTICQLKGLCYQLGTKWCKQMFCSWIDYWYSVWLSLKNVYILNRMLNIMMISIVVCYFTSSVRLECVWTMSMWYERAK